MKSDWVAWLSLGLWLAVPGAMWLGRKWLVTRVEKGVQHSFDVKIEALKADLRQSEEQLKSTLRDREGEITALRATVLAGSAGRQNLLDKRRFEAVERIWTALNDLASLRWVSAFMAISNVDAIATHANDPKIQQFLTLMGSGAPDIGDIKDVARNERPFLPELAWAYFTAFSTVLHGNLALYKVLQLGIGDPREVMSKDGIRKILKAALPHQSKWIDENEPERYHYLLDELESSLLNELRKILDGEEANKIEIDKANGILDAIKTADNEKVKRAADQLNSN